MSDVKERILGAVTVMSEKDAEKIWNMIQATFALANAEEVEADPDELHALNAFRKGDPDYVPFMNEDDVRKELGL